MEQLLQGEGTDPLHLAVARARDLVEEVFAEVEIAVAGYISVQLGYRAVAVTAVVVEAGEVVYRPVLLHPTAYDSCRPSIPAPEFEKVKKALVVDQRRQYAIEVLLQ